MVIRESQVAELNFHNIYVQCTLYKYEYSMRDQVPSTVPVAERAINKCVTYNTRWNVQRTDKEWLTRVYRSASLTDRQT